MRIKEILTNKTMTSDTFKKIGSENFDDGSTSLTLYIENIEEDLTMKYDGMQYKSTSNNWNTDKQLYQDLDKEFHFTFDPCPKKPKYDGLDIKWGSSNFCNPPYDNIERWLLKGIDEWKKGKTVVFLLPVRTSRDWWHDLAMQATEIRFLRGRLKFSGYKWNAGFDSVLIIFNGRPIERTEDFK